jgi:hypothetical protein
MPCLLCGFGKKSARKQYAINQIFGERDDTESMDGQWGTGVSVAAWWLWW